MTFIRIGFTASMLFCALLAAAAVAQQQDQKQSPDMQALAAYVKFLSSGVVQGEQVPVTEPSFELKPLISLMVLCRCGFRYQSRCQLVQSRLRSDVSKCCAVVSSPRRNT
jgi:hypothetical protein